MPFGSLSSAQQIMVRLYMMGGPQYRAEMEKAGLATRRLTGANNSLAASMERVTKRSFLQNQATFMARRGLFYTTLGVVGLGAAIVRMGFQYSSTMQQTSIALGPVIKGTGELDAQMTKLFGIAAFTPFSFEQITSAFRIMYAGFQPLGIQIGTVNELLQGTIDILSFTGQLTPMSLKRVSNALQDMANIGTLTGITIGQLGRLGIPLRTILNKELGITGDQLQHVKDLGLDSQTVLKAIINYSRTAEGVAGAAMRQSQLTLFGAWSTFKDILSQAAGGGVGGPSGQAGIFGTIQKLLVGVNTELNRFYTAGKPITITNIVEAFDKQLSPRTNAIMNTFRFFQGVVLGLAGTFYVLYRAVQLFVGPLDYMAHLIGADHMAAKILGIAVGVLTAVLITGRTALFLYALAAESAKFALWGLGGAIKLVTKLQKAQIAWTLGGSGASGLTRLAKWAFAMETVSRIPGWRSRSGNLEVNRALKNNGLLARSTRSMLTGLAKLRVMLAFGLTSALQAASIATWEFTAALLANPIFWIAAGVVLLTVGLVILYYRWKRFHDLVDDTWRWLRENWRWMRFIVGMIPIFGQLIVTVVELRRHWSQIVGVIKNAIHYVRILIGWINRIKGPSLGDLVPGWVKSITSTSGVDVARGAWNWATRAGGGSVPYTQSVLVGERGPEIVRLPGGSNVIPYEEIRQRQATPVFNMSEMGKSRGGDDKPIVVQVMLDRKVLAEGVARANQDYESRR